MPTTHQTFIITRLAPLLLLACHPTESTDLPICPAQLVAADHAAEADTRQLPADVWLGILVPGFDRHTRTLPSPPATAPAPRSPPPRTPSRRAPSPTTTCPSEQATRKPGNPSCSSGPS
jgi:hypothetical protein